MNRSDILDELRQVGYSAVVSDCCDHVGLRNQTMSSGIVPMSADVGVLVGFARPVRSVGVEAIPEQPYAEEIAFIDSLEADDVVVGTVEAPSAFWGELFSTAARARGAVGVVVDGVIRDRRQIGEMGFPAFARGGRPTDSLGRIAIAERDVPVEIAGVTVSRGDLVVADIDGVVVVPEEAVADVSRRAIEKATTETNARQLLEGGAFLRDAWQKFKVL